MPRHDPALPGATNLPNIRPALTYAQLRMTRRRECTHVTGRPCDMVIHGCCRRREMRAAGVRLRIVLDLAVPGPSRARAMMRRSRAERLKSGLHPWRAMSS